MPINFINEIKNTCYTFNYSYGDRFVLFSVCLYYIIVYLFMYKVFVSLMFKNGRFINRNREYLSNYLSYFDKL